MHLTPREVDKLVLHQAGVLAQNGWRAGCASITRKRSR